MKKRISYLVYDCLASCGIKTYKSKYHAYKRRSKEIETRHLLGNAIAVFEVDK